jgi:hypothetical protein
MERQETKYELRCKAIEIYEEAIWYYRRNILKRTKYNTLITPSLIRNFQKRVDELKEKA